MHDVDAMKLVERIPDFELMTLEEMQSVDGGWERANLAQRLYCAGKHLLLGFAMGMLGTSHIARAICILSE